MVSELINKISTRLTPSVQRAGVGVIVAAVIVMASYQSMWLQPKVISPTAPALGVREVSNFKPLVITFSHPVNQRTLTYQIHPELKGTWKVNSHALVSQSTLTFTPTESPQLATRYTIELAGIKSLMGSRPENYLLSFQTDTLPTVQSVVPADQAADKLPDAPIVLTLDKPLTDVVELSVTLAPEVTVDPPHMAGQTVTFSHATQFQKSTKYSLSVSLATVKVNYLTKSRMVSEKTILLSRTFSTIAAPGVATFSPQGSGVDAASPIQLKFEQAMNRESTQAAFSIVPASAGAFTWADDQTMTFTPSQPLTKGQSYTVTLTNTAKAASGFTPDQNFSWSFTTIGVVTVASWSPVNRAVGIDVSPVLGVTFNQAVVPASAQSKFSIVPAVAGSFTWDGNTMAFHPNSPLAYGTTYTMTMSKGVQTVTGLDSVSQFTSTFTTRNQTIMLSVPAYRQAHVYSCMIAAARSALAFRGVSASEASIISRVGRDTTPWSGTWGGSNGVWGDPDVAIVGPLDNAAATSPAGKKTTNVYWGYGSHWGPIAKALTSYGVANEVRMGMSVADVAHSIAAGNPVIIWWVNGIWPSYQVNWKTPSGKLVHGVNGLHVQVVRGFTGSVDNPISFTLTDSGYGYPGRTFDIGTFKAKWKWFGNTGIIVK